MTASWCCWVGVHSEKSAGWYCWLVVQISSVAALFCQVILSILFFIYIFFYWRIIALQNFVVFCQSQHESAINIHISPLFRTSLPSSSPSHSSRLIQSPCLSFLSHTANSHWLSILHMVELIWVYSVHSWWWVIEVSNSYCLNVYFSLQYHSFLFLFVPLLLDTCIFIVVISFWWIDHSVSV